MYVTSGLSILIHDVISLLDAMSCDKVLYFTFHFIYEITYIFCYIGIFWWLLLNPRFFFHTYLTHSSEIGLVSLLY